MRTSSSPAFFRTTPHVEFRLARRVPGPRPDMTHGLSGCSGTAVRTCLAVGDSGTARAPVLASRTVHAATAIRLLMLRSTGRARSGPGGPIHHTAATAEWVLGHHRIAQRLCSIKFSLHNPVAQTPPDRDIGCTITTLLSSGMIRPVAPAGCGIAPA